MSDLFPLAEFSGQARLFPLPNLVFYPQVMQPLHIFEPRYRQLTRDALDSDRFITMVLPQPGWESDYAGKPALHSIGCLGRILAEQELDDGRYNILLRGLARVRLVREMPSEELYRIAEAKILTEVPIEDEGCAARWRRTLVDKSPGWFPKQGEVIDQFSKLLQSDLGLGALCDIIAFALPLEVEFKQTLLEELNVEQRLKMLHDFLESERTLNEKTHRKFPPEFSVN